jgi:hypothetical protein
VRCAWCGAWCVRSVRVCGVYGLWCVVRGVRVCAVRSTACGAVMRGVLRVV